MRKEKRGSRRRRWKRVRDRYILTEQDLCDELTFILANMSQGLSLRGGDNQPKELGQLPQQDYQQHLDDHPLLDETCCKVHGR